MKCDNFVRDVMWSRRTLLKSVGTGIVGASISIKSSTQVEAQQSDTLTVVTYSEPPTLNCAVNQSLTVQQVSSKMFDGLLAYDFDMKPMPALAESWEFAKDGLSGVFNLRRSVTWHDGKPFTSADVKFSIEEVLKKIHSRGSVTWGNLEAVETPDPYTAIIRFSKPSPSTFIALAASESPIFSCEVYSGGDVRQKLQTLDPVGTGPYKFKQWARGQYLEMEANPRYWKPGKPIMKRLIFRFQPDPGARAASFESGEVQLGYFDPIPAADVERFSKIPSMAIDTVGYDYMAPMTLLLVNPRRKPFDDPRVRKAIRMAIDLKFICNSIWFGRARPAISALHSASKFCIKDLPAYTLDVAKANALLDEAGLKRGADGNRFRMSFPYPNTGENFRTGEYLRIAFAKIGIQADLAPSDVGTFLRRVFGEYDFDIAINTPFLGPDPNMGMQQLYWSKAVSKGTPLVNPGYADPELDKLFEAAQIEADSALRSDLYVQVQKTIWRDLPHIPLIEPIFYTIRDKRLKNTAVVADGPFGSFDEVQYGS
jgi:peptide/nickel transport system substrate-binding protein